jgi:hypothetical protein
LGRILFACEEQPRWPHDHPIDPEFQLFRSRGAARSQSLREFDRELHRVNSRVFAQCVDHLIQLLGRPAGKIEENPFATRNLARPAAAATEPFSPDSIAQSICQLGRLFQELNCVHLIESIRKD